MLRLCFTAFKILLLYSFFFSIINLYCQSETSISTYTVNIVYPWEGKNIGSVSKSFVFGNVNPIPSTITVNGQIVKPYKNGSFIAYVSISTSDPSFVVNAGESIYRRNVVITDNRRNFDDKTPFELLSSSYVYISKGSDICISFKGLANTSVMVKVDKIVNSVVDDDKKGNFEYCFSIPVNIKAKNYDIILKYTQGKLKGEKAIFKDFLRIFDGYYMVETSTDNVVLKNDAGGYILFLEPGINLFCDMIDSKRCRAVLGDMKLYADLDKLDIKRISHRILNSKISGVKLIKTSLNRVLARIFTSMKVAFAIWEDDKKLYLEISNSAANINWIVYDPKDNFISSVMFRQNLDNKTLFTFNFKDDNLCGYNVSYSTEGTLDIEFKFKPFIPSLFIPQPLKGINIIIDPGHSPKTTPPYDGAVGPSGSFEYSVNLEIAKKLYEKFVSYGANVYMTRTSNDPIEQIPLSERPRIAKRIDGDIYISIHNNAIADGEDPYSKPRGFQIYYYHLHSKKLADAIHESFVKNIPLPDEGVRYGDYMVARIHNMPSVLVENAYMILPEHEEMLLDPLWQDRFAQAIFEGVIEFMK